MSRAPLPADETQHGDVALAVTPRDEGLYAGRYRIEALVGRGGMGTVYRAVDVLVGDVVALKVLAGGVTQQHLEGFRREVRLARKISHPNVARTHDMGEHAGSPYLIMEFVEGTTLQAMLRASDSGITPVQAARIALSVCEALTAAHAAGVIHRDLKPANILVEHEGRVVLTDFGIARPIDGAHTQGMLGTPLYMAPEQVTGQSVDVRTDLYAVGVVLFEMLTGRLPFAGDTAFAAALARLDSAPKDILTVRPDTPPALAELVRACLEAEPRRRPASAAQVAMELRAWLGDEVPSGTLGLAHPPPTTATSTPRSGINSPPIAVLPFRYQGPPASAYVGDALTDELIDVLSRTGGLRVSGSGATLRYRDSRDPRALGVDLGVGYVVDATLQATPAQLRVQARLVEVHSGLQVFSDRFDADASDLLAAQELLSKKIAEALRIELMSLAHRRTGTPEAIALYRRARRKILGGHFLGSDGAIELLEECLQVSPNFAPAVAVYAVACVRGWFGNRKVQAERDWETLARRTVARASELAPELAETHFARGMLAVQAGPWRDAVQAFVHAIELAPTYAHAHEYLSQLQCEAGNLEEGVARAKLAAALEPSLLMALSHVARVHALDGDLDTALKYIAQLEARPHYAFQGLISRVRFAGWHRDLDAVRKIHHRVVASNVGDRDNMALFVCRSLLGEFDREALIRRIHAQLEVGPSPRLYSSICQVGAEVFALLGHPDDALDMLDLACKSRLIDADWLDRCIALAPLREHPRFIAVRREVAARVEAMWIV